MKTSYSLKMFMVKLATVLLIGVMAVPVLAAPQPQEVNLWVSRDVAPGPKVRVNINTRNTRMVRMVIYPVSGMQWLLQRDRTPKKPPATGKPLMSYLVDTAPKNEKRDALQYDMYRSRQVNLPPLPSGVYLLSLEATGAPTKWAVVNITQLAVVVKRSPQRLLTWVTDFKTGASLAKARVTLYNADGSKAAESLTRADGTVLLNQPRSTPVAGQTVVVTRGRDMAGVPVDAAQNPDGKFKMHFQTDRPIYRPGQTVHFKTILRRTRGRGWEPVANTACKVEVRDSKDFVLLEKQITTNAIGTLSGEVKLPVEGMLGQYSVIIHVPGTAPQYGSFSVAEYRKPEFKVVVTPAQKRYLAGDKIDFKLQANYYFGAPLPNATVRYTVRRSDLAFPTGDDGASYWYGGDGNLYDHDTYYRAPFVAEGTATTDAKGAAAISIKSDPKASDSTYTIETTVTDASRRQVQESASVAAYRAAIRLHISSEYSFVPQGYLIPLQLRATDLDGKPVAARVTLVLKREAWNEKEGRSRYVEVTRTVVTIPTSGKATAKLPAQVGGSLLVQASAPDGSGRTATSALSYWVSDPFSGLYKAPKHPTLQLKLDRRSYAPGQIAKVLASTNTPTRPRPSVAEGLDIWSYQVVMPGKKSTTWDVPAKLEMSPNATISAAQWVGGQMLSDNKVMPIPDPSRKLNVEIKADRNDYRPGDTANYTLRTRGHDGKPVPAEVAVSIVDEAIYALRPDTTPDLYGVFWAMRENYVSTATSAPEELSGGAYQRVNKMASVRERFLDSAFWNARVTTGADGTARFSVPLPGNLTTWRATARAVTGETRVGAGKSSVQAARSVMLRLATPRQMVRGDRVRLIGTVHNRTGKDREFETAISAKGLKIEGAATSTILVAAGGEKTLEWTLIADTLPEDGQAIITGRTLATDAPRDQGEEYSDVLRVPIRVAPAGVLQRIVVGGTLEQEQTFKLSLPTERVEPASVYRLTVYSGLAPVLRATASALLAQGRDSSPTAASRLVVAAAAPDTVPADEAREALAMLSRYQQGSGAWGWWEDDAPDAAITTAVLESLAHARAAKITVPATLVQRGLSGAQMLFNQSNLPERRALLAAAMTLLDKSAGLPLLDEVQRRGGAFSPVARLSMAEALARSGRAGEARRIVGEVLEDAVRQSQTAFLPVGMRDGWSGTTTEATARALSVLSYLNRDRSLQSKLAQWLANPQDGNWRSSQENAAIVRALSDYIGSRPQASQLGTVEVTVNGQPAKLQALEYSGAAAGVSKDSLNFDIPRTLLRDGDNEVSLRRSERGEVFVTLEARVFRPATEETNNGIRVFRRFDVQNTANVWEELRRAVKPGEPVRCTVVVWPDDRADGIRVIEPLAAGFEYVDSDNYGGSSRQEVRDGAVVHYLRGKGVPITFRYYLRAESGGVMLALPATAEVLRQPSTRGSSIAQQLEVEK